MLNYIRYRYLSPTPPIRDKVKLILLKLGAYRMKQLLNTAIHFQNVDFHVNDMHILKNITGSFTKGHITTLVGPSGAGKTTLIKMCNGLLSPASGMIYINSESITAFEPVALRRLVGLALQAAPMIKGSVYENLALPRILQNKTLTMEEACSFLDDVGLNEGFLHRKADELSGGQRQKVSIARTLINKSDILLLDEITAALDRHSAHEIEELIIKINRKYGVTIIWITHNLQQALTIGQDTWVMIDGKLIESGESEILQTSSNPLVQQFVQGALS